MTDLVPLNLPATELASDDVQRLLGAWLQNRAPQTRAAYERDLRDFAKFQGYPRDAETALHLLLQLPAPRAHLRALEYLGHLRARGVAPSTARRRLSTLKSVLRVARTIGIIEWRLELDAPRGESKTTEGPPLEVVRQAFGAIEDAYEGAEQARLRLLLRLLYDLSLRAGEPGTVFWPDDVDMRRGPYGALHVLRKRRAHREPWHLTERARHALDRWLEFRGFDKGPLIWSFNRRRAKPLSARVVHTLVRDLGATIGHKLTPNGLRHTANTIAMVEGQKAGYTIDEVMQFTSHRQPQTLLAYKDQLRETQTKIAALVSDASR